MPKVRRLSCTARVVLFLCHLACSAMERIVLLCPNAFSEMESSYLPVLAPPPGGGGASTQQGGAHVRQHKVPSVVFAEVLVEALTGLCRRMVGTLCSLGVLSLQGRPVLLVFGFAFRLALLLQLGVVVYLYSRLELLHPLIHLVLALRDLGHVYGLVALDRLYDRLGERQMGMREQLQDLADR